MKKIILASIVLSSMGIANVASAANGEVQFIGAVTAITCDLTPEVGGAINNLVQLGTASTGDKATAVDFTLKADSSAGCQALDTAKTASITWAGNLGAQGLDNASGAATGAWVELKTKNAKTTPEQTITSANPTVDFSGDAIKTSGAQFTAQLNGGAVPGDFRTASAFVVAYK